MYAAMEILVPAGFLSIMRLSVMKIFRPVTCGSVHTLREKHLADFLKVWFTFGLVQLVFRSVIS